MAPNSTSEDIVIRREDNLKVPMATPTESRRYHIVWVNVVAFSYYHLAALYGLYLCFTTAKWQTITLGFATYYLSCIGTTAGAHRLWSHKTYKATRPLQIFLMLCHSLANQHSIFHWARNHRMHHKYSDTDADPHNATRGFFYSHIGWILVKKHPEVKKKGQFMDLSDLTSNPVVMFQKRHQHWFIIFVAFVVPTIFAMVFWGESVSEAYHVNMLRYVLALNATFLVNSLAHMWGWKPYDSSVLPANNAVVVMATLGEGFHNFHHVFPHDYRTGELGNNATNFTTAFIDLCAALGLAYDLRSVSQEAIDNRMARTGDGTDLKGKPLRDHNILKQEN